VGLLNLPWWAFNWAPSDAAKAGWQAHPKRAWLCLLHGVGSVGSALAGANIAAAAGAVARLATRQTVRSAQPRQFQAQSSEPQQIQPAFANSTSAGKTRTAGFLRRTACIACKVMEPQRVQRREVVQALAPYRSDTGFDMDG